MQKFYLQIIMLCLLFLGVSANVSAQGNNTPDVVVKGKGKVTKIVRRIKPFTEISAAGPFELVLHQSKMEDAYVEIDENLQQYVSVKSDGKVLKIEVQKGYTLKEYHKFVVYVRCVDINRISAAGLPNLETDEPFTLKNLNMSLAGVGKGNFDLTLNKLEVSAAGCGDMKIVGKGDIATISNAGGGEIDVLGFKVRNITANLTGGANASIYTQDKMEVNVNATGAKPAKKKGEK